MRINKYLAQSGSLSRRAADVAIKNGRVRINDSPASLGSTVTPADIVMLDNRVITPSVKMLTILFNKPVGYVCSREGQGSLTIYELLPIELHHLQPVGRLDKDSSGLLVMTNDGSLANRLAHPSHQKEKIYHIQLDRTLTSSDEASIVQGIELDDGLSKLGVTPLNPGRTSWEISMTEGRNRQIRRTFEAKNYNVINLHRIKFGDFELGQLELGAWQYV